MMTIKTIETTSSTREAVISSPLHVNVLTDRCAGCQECLIRCPTNALTMDLASWTVVADDSACVGCRQCVRTCPFSAITVEGPVLVSSRETFSLAHPQKIVGNLEETRKGFTSWAQAKSEANRCLTCPDATCVRGCPAHNDIPRFIAAIRDENLKEAHDVLRLTSFLPDVCSRVCDQALQCEGACTWSLAGGEGVAIGALERFVTDNAPVPPVRRTSDRGAGISVAIVGSGPAGISAAWELVQASASVTVFEKDDNPGGLLKWGIPDFTLPDEIASRPWEALVAAGVKLHCESEVSADQVRSLAQTYDAVVLAHGAGTPLRLPVEGGALERVWDATRFLHQAPSAVLSNQSLSDLTGEEDPSGVRIRTVLVVGAGNTAMDVARLVRRLGARAICVDWMDRRFAPVRPDELEEASLEGVDIRFSTTVDHLESVGDGLVKAHLNFTEQKSALGKPEVIAKLAASEVVDLVVMAMGYRVDTSFSTILPHSPISRRALPGLTDRRWQASGLLAGGAPVFARNQPIGQLALGRESAYAQADANVAERVWAAGDALVGPATVVEAMAQGRRVAQAILSSRSSRSV
ncbi:MAG TPA: FAD-dependent oxidoreductase [Candidatus Nanopelagicaceae bacterium]